MDESKLHDVCASYQGSSSKYYTDPIPEKKISNARQCLNVPYFEKIFALIDLTAFGSAKDALVVTDRGLHWKKSGSQITVLTWEQLRQCTPTKDSGVMWQSIDFGNGKKIDLGGAGNLQKNDNNVVIDLMNDLRDLAGIVVYNAPPKKTCAPCYNCEGSGYIDIPDSSNIKECSFCCGAGEIDNVLSLSNEDQDIEEYQDEPNCSLAECDNCEGFGFFDTPDSSDIKECPACCGTGETNKALSLGNEGPMDIEKYQDEPNHALTKCEFCRGKIKPEVTYCKHCGIKLRG